MSKRFAEENRLERTEISRRSIIGINGEPTIVTAAARMRLDIEGHEEIMWAYENEGDNEYDIILGRPWMDRQRVTIAPAKKSLFIHSTQTRIRSKEGRRPPLTVREVNAAAYMAWVNRSKAQPKIQIFAASMADIQKALQVKKQGPESLAKLPKFLQELRHVFERKEADKLPPHRGPNVDHAIELIQENGKEPEVPWGPLYGMSREELLVLRKELTSYLDRGFIRVSRSSAAAPVLFVKKPGGGLRFCVDYRALNAITRKDRYPLPLIHETLNQIGQAKWFTKLDVIQAFHKIRIAEGDEWKTAFRTRFGLYEWLVCPFGLANAPSTFQRYINWTLKDHIDEDASAFLDDVLIYSNGTKADHKRRVKIIVEKLGKAGLQLDINKCEFGVKKTKYLGFIVEAEKGISMDPEKIRAITEWEPPRSIRGVRSFVGFANFYRQFIKEFSSIVAPLTKLTGKNAEFIWEPAQQEAFTKLKEAFVTEPALAFFDPELETIMETDASGMSSGGTLSQFGRDGILRTVAYFSAKHSPAECNYNIHDKELLAVIKCLSEWNAELRAVPSFTVYSDHKNLEYFGKAQQLQERHVRWLEILSRFNLQFAYRPGHANGRADALSRKEEDLPTNQDDLRVKSRFFQMLRPVTTPDPDPTLGIQEDEPDSLRAYMTKTPRVLQQDTKGLLTTTTCNKPIADKRKQTQDVWQEVGNECYNAPKEHSTTKANRGEKPGLVLETPEQVPVRTGSTVLPALTTPADNLSLGELWRESADKDPTYQSAVQAMQQGLRKFPPQLSLKVSLSECTLDGENLLYRGRKWVPDADQLRTQLISETHNSPLAGHPGRENTYKMLARDFFWPGMGPDIRRYIKNCDICGRTKPWRELKQGFLLPLPVPDQIWKEISMDFIVDLPESQGYRHLMVITDRLSKDLVLAPLPNLEVETVARKFIERAVAYHWLPDAIVSDRGGQFVGAFWKTLCKLLGIERRVSTAFHPETDGATERMNSTVEAYLRAFVNWAQNNWAELCPMAQAAIRGRPATSTKVSPFFLQHGYEADLIQLMDDELVLERHRSTLNPERAATELVRKLKATVEFVQASMAEAQQAQEAQANKHRQEAPQLRIGDRVWLQYGRQLSNGRPSKKLDWKNGKFRVAEVISPHSVQLSTPPGIHPVFHVDRLRLAGSNPLEGQTIDDWQPEGIRVDGEEEWQVEDIVGERNRRIGRGTTLEYLVQWVGYTMCSWEPSEYLTNTEALTRWTQYSQGHRNSKGTLPEDFRKGTPNEPPSRRR